MLMAVVLTAALVAAVVAGVDLAHAQEQTLFVSNLNQRGAGYGQSGAEVLTSAQAQSFRTGANLHDYELRSVDLRLGPEQAGAGGILVQVMPAGDDGAPDGSDSSKVITLDSAGSVAAMAVNSFVAPLEALLDADREYFVVVTSADGAGPPQFALTQTPSVNEDRDRAPGWSIGNGRLWRHESLDRWTRVENNVIQMRVSGEIRTGTGDPVVTIDAEQQTILEGVDDASFTVTRTGSTANPLTVEIQVSQNRPYLPMSSLSSDVTILAGDATANFTINAADFRRLPVGTSVFDGTITVTTATTSSYDVVSATPASVHVTPLITFGIEFDEPVITEELGAPARLVALTGVGAPAPTATYHISISTRPGDGTGGAASPQDYAALSSIVEILPADFVADGSRYRAEVPFTVEIVEDDIAESDEDFVVLLERAPESPELAQGRYFVSALGTRCSNSCEYEATIKGDFEAGVTMELVTNGSETPESGQSKALVAESFTTGSHPFGYLLGEVTLFLRASSTLSTSGAAFVELKADDFDEPGNRLANLTNPQTLADDAMNSFMAPTGTVLAPDTTYWVVVNEQITTAADRLGVVSTSSGDERSLEKPPWTIGDGRLERASTSDGWLEKGETMMMAVVGAAAVIELGADATIETTTLSWSSPHAGVLGYRVEVSYNDGETWHDLQADPNSTDTSYTHDATLGRGEERSYRIWGITAEGLTEPSNTVVATATDLLPTLVATGLSPDTDPQAAAIINVCWTLGDVSPYDLDDVRWESRWQVPPVVTDRIDRWWRPLSSGGRPDCPEGTIGVRITPKVPNLTYSNFMSARQGDRWLISNDATAVSIDTARQLEAGVTAGYAGLSVDSEVPATVCVDFDDPVTAEDEAGSFYVSVSFASWPLLVLGMNEPVTGFDIADLDLENATATLLDHPYHRLLGYRVRITPTTFGQPVSVTVPAGVVTHPATGAQNQESNEFTRKTSNSTCHPDGAGLPELWPPNVWRMRILPDADGNGEWTEGERVRVELKFYEEIIVSAGATPTVAVLLDGADAEARYAAGSGTRDLVFEHLVTAEQSPVTSVTLLPNTLALNGGGMVGIGGGLELDLRHDWTSN